MPVVTIVIGSALTILGIAAFVLTGSQFPTALIPLYFGTVFEILGGISLISPKLRKHMMHGVAMLALLGVLGTIGGVVAGVKWIGGNPPAQPAAVYSKVLMFALCLLLEVLCVNSFIVARRNRERLAAAPGNPTL